MTKAVLENLESIFEKSPNGCGKIFDQANTLVPLKVSCLRDFFVKVLGFC